MSAPHYELYACDPFGVRLADLSNFVRLSYTRIVNDWSTAVVTLPANTDLSLLRIPDGRLEIWRDGRLVTDTIWLMRVLRPKRDGTGKVTIELEADTPLSILREPGRIGQKPYGSNFGDIESFTAVYALHYCWLSTANSFVQQPEVGRDISAFIGINRAHATEGPLISKVTTNRAILDLMREIAQDSAQQGTYIAFDIVALTVDTLQFTVFLNQRGVDRRSPGGIAPVVLSPGNGSLGETSLEINYRDEVTVAYAFGRGTQTKRPVSYQLDRARVDASPFGWRELMVDYNDSADTTVLTGVARAAVRAGRPLIVLSGKVISKEGCQYGVHWDWGDYVTVSDFGYTLDARIDAITVTVEATSGGPFETIEANVRSEAYL